MIPDGPADWNLSETIDHLAAKTSGLASGGLKAMADSFSFRATFKLTPEVIWRFRRII